MGGLGIAMDSREAASALRWWLEAGVDVAIQEQPRNWLAPSPEAPAAIPEKGGALAPPPATLDEFREWLAGPQAPLASGQSKAVFPQGAVGAGVMLLSEPPGRDELGDGMPIGGEAAQLMQRMLAAIGLQDSAYSANLACFHSPAARLSPAELERCAAAALHHVALAAPKRLLLLGDAPCRALLGKALLQARGHVHKVEGVRTVATFHPRQLIKRPSDKALAWKDLLLLIEEPV